MKHWHILYNPKAGGDNGTQRARKLDTLLEGEKTYADITAIADMTAYLKKIPAEQSIVLCGGDGTLSRFVNQTEPADLPELYFYAIGSGNDFLHDLGYQEGQPPFPIREYLQHLPVVETNGQKRRFINGVGYGVDGEVCAEGARLREKNKGKINYTAIAVKCVLFGYKPMGATVTVDGVTKRYRKAWLAPAMKGRYFGGGMMIAPDQQREDAQHRLSIVVAHDLGKWTLMSVFPTIYKGKHVKYTKWVDITRGSAAEICFDQPTAMQIDGEVIEGVTSYKVYCE